MSDVATTGNVVPLRKGAWLTSSSYAAASTSSVELGAWNPAGLSPDAAILEDRKAIDARAHDLVRNNEVAHSLIKRKVDNVLGPNVKLQVQVDYNALGITAEQGRELNKAIESEWALFTRDPARNCDAGQRLNFGMMARVLYRHWKVDGRCLTVPMWLPNRGGRYGTAFRLVDPQRLSNPYGKPNSSTLRDGIEINSYGAPVAYWIRNANPGDLLMVDLSKNFSWTRIMAVTAWGRKRVIHCFDQTQAEQTQGISHLAPVMTKMRMLGKRDELELQRAGINATYAAFIKSALPSDLMFKALTEAPDGADDDGLGAVEAYSLFQNQFYENRSYIFNGARVGHLLPGEEFQTVNPQGPGGDFETSQRVWLRGVAAAGGVTYEQLTYDYSQVNYSSARAASAEVKKDDQADLECFAEGALTPMVDCWLEEAIETGRIKLPRGAPSYYDMRAAYCRLVWTSPGTAAIDPNKEANAGETLLSSGQYTLADYLAEDGRDPEDHFAQLAAEKALAADYGIAWPPQKAGPMAAAPADDQADDMPPPPRKKGPAK